MSLAAIQSAIYSRFGAATPTGWNRATWPVVPENQKWSLAEHGAAKQPEDKAWGRLNVRMAGSNDTSVDATARRVTGLLWLQIFVPEEKGSLVAQQMGDEMERVFGRKTITGGGETIRFERAVTNFVASGGDGWQQHRCIISFISDAVTP